MTNCSRKFNDAYLSDEEAMAPRLALADISSVFAARLDLESDLAVMLTSE